MVLINSRGVRGGILSSVTVWCISSTELVVLLFVVSAFQAKEWMVSSTHSALKNTHLCHIHSWLLFIEILHVSCLQHLPNHRPTGHLIFGTGRRIDPVRSKYKHTHTVTHRNKHVISKQGPLYHCVHLPRLLLLRAPLNVCDTSPRLLRAARRCTLTKWKTIWGNKEQS